MHGYPCALALNEVKFQLDSTADASISPSHVSESVVQARNQTSASNTKDATTPNAEPRPIFFGEDPPVTGVGILGTRTYSTQAVLASSIP
jgi:hypothetical protein